MNCVIIEDEKNAADYLEYQLSQCSQKINVQARLNSVKNAVQWLSNNRTDVIFLDVQLGDDLSFSIFDNIQLKTPVIFTTSYDEYAIKAFELNSIAYLLKPVDKNELQHALDKFDELFSSEKKYEKLSRLPGQFQKRFLVQSGADIISVPTEDIAYFHVQNKHLFVTLKKGPQYLFDSTLEAVEERLDPEMFFRINRQFIVSVNAIEKMTSHSRGRVILTTTPPSKEEMIVSIDRAVEFKNWLNR